MWILLDGEDFLVNIDQCDCISVTDEQDTESFPTGKKEIRAEAGEGIISLTTCDSAEQGKSIIKALIEAMKDDRDFWTMSEIEGVARSSNPDVWYSIL